jgi:hypothetical protein
MTLTNENYYSLEANREYMSVSQYKQFCKCEAAAMAELNGEYKRPMTAALLIGSYVDAWIEGTLDKFKEEHPEMKGANIKKAEEVIEVIKNTPGFKPYLSGEKQVIMTAELFGTPWKIKIDDYSKGERITDWKVMRSMERIMGKSFVEYWGYDLQMAIYAAVEKNDLDTVLAVVTKQNPPDKDVIRIPKWRREEILEEVKRNMPHILSVKSGEIPPERCGVCEYCRATKTIEEPIDFEMVGLSTAERRAILGV